MNIKELSPVWSCCDEPDSIKPLLVYQKEFWRKEGFRRTRTVYPRYLVDKKGMFLSGFIPRIEETFQAESERLGMLPLTDNPILPGITFREDQERLITAALAHQRGVIVSPTGTGKTVIACGIVSCVLPEHKVLILCHTISLLKQTKDELAKFFPDYHISLVGSGTKDLSGSVVVATIQSFSKLDVEERDVFDIIIVDECHHVCSENSLYYKTLTSMTALMRIGITATLPGEGEPKLIMEGVLGKVLGELGMREALRKKILSEPVVKLIKTGYNNNARELRNYQDIYDAVITDSRERNRAIIQEIKRLNSEGRSTITYINKLEHGKNLMNLAVSHNVDIVFIQGETDGEFREVIRKKLQQKEVMNVLATTVWKEGINIPSVNCILIAGGGKKELTLLQTIGRGLRRDDGKDEVLIVDFLDTAKYISEHCIERIGVYLEKGWL